jgi:YggT family protein
MTAANGNDVVSELICLLVFVFMIVLFVRVVLSWLQLAGWRPPPSGPIRSAHDVLIDVTEPPLRLLRRVVPPAGMIDLSVLVALVVLFVLRTLFC